MDPLDRQPIWPLAVGLAASLLINATVIFTTASWSGLASRAGERSDRDSDHPPRRRPPDQPELGQADSKKSTVAWISHDAYQKLLARKSKTRQPAVQQQARPTPNAPMELAPTPPVPRPQPERPTRKLRGEPPRLARVAPPTPGLRHKPSATGSIPFQPRRVEKTERPRRREPTQQKSRRTGGQRGQANESTPRPQPTSDRKAKPTAVPQANKAAPPSDIRVNPQDFQFGEVIARDGIEIRTVTPSFTAVAEVSSVGANLPTAELTFNPKGQVVSAEMLRSTGYDNLDSPILASLYQWQATGPKLNTVESEFSITIRFTRGEK